MIERNILEVEHPPLRAFRQLSNYFNNEQRKEIYKVLQIPKKLKYKYWMSWLNIAITRMNKTEYRNYIGKVNLINVSERTY